MNKDANKYRSFDGHGNNIDNPDWGQANSPLLRFSPIAYGDGINTLAQRGPHNPNPRVISNAVFQQSASVPSKNNLSDFIWAWGQFLDHELDLTTTNNQEKADIVVPDHDIVLCNLQLKGREFSIPFSRSAAIEDTGTSPSNPRLHANVNSSYIDGSVVYGSDMERASALRTFDGTGRLKTSTSESGELLPYNINDLENEDNGDAQHDRFFLAGDVRANEHAVLTSIHTLFVREHNRLCLDIIACDPSLAGQEELIYQKARKYVGGIIQAITYEEFLPALLGQSAISPYTGYRPNVNAGISHEFSTACYRLGHSMLSSELMLGGNGNTIQLRDMFFKPYFVRLHGIEAILMGLTLQRMQEVDAQIVEDVRSFLFGPPNQVKGQLLDLAALNIQRGRDHGLAGYNAFREAFGLNRLKDFSEITSDTNVANILCDLYKDIDYVDPWVGALAEDQVEGSNVGPLIFAVLKNQFERARDGDRFWYANDPELTIEQRVEIESTRLSDVIRRNTDLEDIPDNVFIAQI